MKIINTKSVLISIILCALVIAAIVFLMIVLPISDFPLTVMMTKGISDMTAMFISSYLMAVIVIVIMAVLIWVLLNIKRGNVFIMSNVKALRIVSWLCLLCAADVCLLFLAGLTLSPIIIAFVAVVCSMLIRVVKNAFYEATVIKDENDLTV